MNSEANGHRPRNPAVTSRLMSRVRATENRAEVLLRKTLWRRGHRYRLYDRRLPGTPNLVFPSCKVAVFVDGDFWHGRILLEHGYPALEKSFRTERKIFWLEKITKNVARDRRNDVELSALGWRVLRVWEREILQDVESVADRVANFLKSATEVTHGINS